MRRFGITAALGLAVITGCGAISTSSSGMSYPAGASLEQFGLRERCAGEGDCDERAMEAIRAALGRLGPGDPEHPDHGATAARRFPRTASTSR